MAEHHPKPKPRLSDTLSISPNFLKQLKFIVSVLTPFIVVSWFLINQTIDRAVDKLQKDVISQLATRQDLKDASRALWERVGKLDERLDQLEKQDVELRARLDAIDRLHRGGNR